ncbi:unnamed protein product [Mytilus edulis]|uniref:Uncharacterized protein n=1 Tax=Mytilus edulis TaxID=6550 RepID=A0A8S3R0W3_MYTED|nr:unnamed protein product [Mytilus edulis]
MTADMEVSKTLYHYLCESIGTEEVVKLRRQYYASLDCFMERNDVTFISSGSKAEGLEMGSDFDAMLLLPFVIVNEEPNDDLTIPNRFFMDTEDCNPGFTQIKGQSHQYSALFKLLCVMHEGKYRLESGDYEAALCLISHASVNCSSNKLFQGKNRLNSINMHEVEKADIEHSLYKNRYLYRRHAIDEISFYLGSKVFPSELGIQATFQAYITPPVYIYFLRFLCLYHLKQDSDCITSVQDMIKASKDEHFNPDNYSLSENFKM